MIRATYRLQFRDGVGFREAAAIVPQLAAAGISHLYASPIFSAASGSTHGYDVTDHNCLDPVLGATADFDALVEELHRHGMGLVLDIVPNHMAASPENLWWRDVLKHGQGSRYGRHFDIDWSRKLILPILGKPYGRALADGDIVRGEHPEWGPVLKVPGHDLPLAPGTETIADVHALHEAQHYRVAYWRLGRDGLTYRRFFEITGLVGVRVEDEAVFDDVHALVERLVREGKVQAVRVDHVDGLAEPGAYLGRLSGRLGVPVFVEKILEGDERLPPWPVEGTTGYEFIAGLTALLADPTGLARLSADYAAISEDDVDRLSREAKREIVTRNLAGELEHLTRVVLALFARDPATRDWGRATVREAIAALMVGMPVYRTYLSEGADEQDVAVLAEARRRAAAEPLEDEAVLDDLVALLLARDDDPLRHELVIRFQQTTGPAMAKSEEDTLFYRHHRLLALNEVGGGPDQELGPGPFLRAARTGGLAPISTHDTKRGADARARLLALSDPEAAAVWSHLWQAMPGAVPDRLRWAFAQMLFASTPLAPDPTFTDRFREAALKTVREAQEETSWTRGDPAFEAIVAEAAEAMAAAADRFAWLERVTRAGAVLGLTQALLQTVCRPAPDVYEGGFGWDLAMVDPDNRRPVDFTAEAALIARARETPLAELAADWRDGAIKAKVLLEGLAARAERPDLFARGDLRPVPLTGSASGAFFAIARESGEDLAVAVVPIRPLPLLGEVGLGLSVSGLGLDISRSLSERISGTALPPGGVDLSDHFAKAPVLVATSW